MFGHTTGSIWTLCDKSSWARPKTPEGNGREGKTREQEGRRRGESCEQNKTQQSSTWLKIPQHGATRYAEDTWNNYTYTCTVHHTYKASFSKLHLNTPDAKVIGKFRVVIWDDLVIAAVSFQLKLVLTLQDLKNFQNTKMSHLFTGRLKLRLSFLQVQVSSMQHCVLPQVGVENPAFL